MSVAVANSPQYIKCLICSEHNNHAHSLCRQCSAPLSLVRSTLQAGRDPCMVSVLGDSNVGKTVYLGFLLDMLAQRAGEFEAIPRDPRSVDLSQTVISHLAWRMFPPKTPLEANQWNWAYYEVCHKGARERYVDLITPDLPGEAIAAEVGSPTTFKIVQNLMNKSAGLLLLVDAALAAHGSAQPDFFALKMLSYIENYSNEKQTTKINTPIAIVLTKSDYVPECFDDPTQFAKANVNRLYNMVDRRCSKFRFFASSVVGSIGFATGGEDGSVRAVPLHTALRGILEPFEWIVGQL
jgi:hypothetical protein